MDDTAACQMLNLHFTGGTFCQYNIRIGPVNRFPEKSADIITEGVVFGLHARRPRKTAAAAVEVCHGDSQLTQHLKRGFGTVHGFEVAWGVVIDFSALCIAGLKTGPGGMAHCEIFHQFHGCGTDFSGLLDIHQQRQFFLEEHRSAGFGTDNFPAFVHIRHQRLQIVFHVPAGLFEIAIDIGRQGCGTLVGNFNMDMTMP